MAIDIRPYLPDWCKPQQHRQEVNRREVGQVERPGETPSASPNQAKREFWTIRALFLGAAAVLSIIEVYLNAVVFSGLVALIGVAFAIVCNGTIVVSTFLNQSPNKKVRRTAKASDWIGLATSTAVCCVWWYGASSIETAGHRMQEWEAALNKYSEAVTQSRADYRAAVADYNTCRSRPIATLPREERGEALGNCEQIAHSLGDFQVAVPNPGSRPAESAASVAADWKPWIRGLGIFGLVVAISSIGLMVVFASFPEMHAPSALEQAEVLGKIRIESVSQWPTLTREQVRQSAALLSVRQGVAATWPTPSVGEVFGPRFKDWRTAFCSNSNLVRLTYSPSLLTLSKSLETDPVSVVLKAREVAPVAEVGRDDQDGTGRPDQDDFSNDSSSLPVVPTRPELVPTVEQKRKTTIICNGAYKLVPRTDGGWKLQTGTPARDLCRLTGTEAETVMIVPQDEQMNALRLTLKAKGKEDLLPAESQLIRFKTRAG